MINEGGFRVIVDCTLSDLVDCISRCDALEYSAITPASFAWLEWRERGSQVAVLLELLTFNFSVLFMLVDSEHTDSSMVYPRFYRGRNGQSGGQLERADEIVAE